MVGAAAAGAAAVVRKADLPEVARNCLGGGRTLGLVSHLLSFGLAFSSAFSVWMSRRWRRPKGAPVGGGWLAKRLIALC